MASCSGRDSDASNQVKPWRVLHACDSMLLPAMLVDAEASAGMNPQLLSREMWGRCDHPGHVSLLTAWNDVRDWRHALNEAEALNSFQIIHAHSFASAMAGVRGTVPLVYDFSSTLEETGTPHAHPGPWLLRSLRVAEQFALSRAGAVVTHSKKMKAIAHDRGASLDNIFTVPEPVAMNEFPSSTDWALERGIDSSRNQVLFALGDPNPPEFLLGLVGAVLKKCERAMLILEVEDAQRDSLIRLARQLEVADSIRCVGTSDRHHAIASANVVLAPPTHDPGARANEGMLQSMSAGCGVIAADVPENRECSPEGQGCLWYRDGDQNELFHVLTSLLADANLRSSLGNSGREYIRASRSPEVIGHAYDEIYRHAHSRRSENAPRLPAPRIYALDAI